MKRLEKLFVAVIITGLLCMVLFAFTSCSRYISVDDAASGKARCGQHLR